MAPLQGNDRKCFAFIWEQNNWEVNCVPDLSIIAALVALCQTRWEIFTAAPLWVQHSSNQLMAALPAAQMGHRSSGPCPGLGTGAEETSPQCHFHMGIAPLTSVDPLLSGCVTHRFWGCLILQLSVKSSNFLPTSQDATSVQHSQDMSLVSMCAEQVLEEHLLTTNYLNSFFPFYPTNISPSQTQGVLLYTVFKMHTSFSRSWLQGGQHTCRYFEVAKEKKKDNATAEKWSMTFLLFGDFFSVPANIQ